MKKLGVIIATVIMFLILLTSCAPGTKVILQGRVVSQEVKTTWMYDIVTYTISSDNEQITFKVRDGWALIPNHEYLFYLNHVEKDEYTAISIEQIP